MQRSFLVEATIERKVLKKIKKDGYALFTNDGIEAHITSVDDGVAYGLTHLDDDVAIDLNNLGEWVLDEGTAAADIAQSTAPMGKRKKCKKKKDMEDMEDMENESAVGLVGRTGFQDAKNHISDELRKEFKRIVKALGGKTVARQLLAEMNAGL